MKHIKAISIDQLKLGMFIVGMDQPWYRTPFLLHKRLIRHAKDIDLLRQHGIREVTIDPSRGLDVEPGPAGNLNPASHSHEAIAPAGPILEVPLASSNESCQPASNAEKILAEPLPTTQQDVTHAHATTQPSHPTKPAALEEVSLPAASGGETKAAQPRPPFVQQDASTPSSQTQDVIAAAQPVSVMELGPQEAASEPPSGKEMNSALPTSGLPDERPMPPPTREQAIAAQETYREANLSVERMFEELEAGIVPRPDTLRVVVSNVLTRVLDDGASMLSLLSLQKMKRFDRTLASHALDVCTLSLIVAHDFGVAEGDLEMLGAGALLHDIGYVRLPRNLYRRSHELTEQEHTMMEQHPALGLAMLHDAKENRDTVVRIVVEHHECHNGSGFPHKLTGDSISVLAQLVGLVDIYDGMVSRRGGHPAMLPHDAIRQLFRLGDTGQYAKDLIQTMIGSLGVYPIGSLVLMNTGEQAVVVGMNYTQRLKPVVKVITGPHGGSYLTPIRIDLGAQAVGKSAKTITKILDPLHERVNVAMFLDGIHEEAA
jgi:putative nucleotidyltransferase with HDIG domain